MPDRVSRASQLCRTYKKWCPFGYVRGETNKYHDATKEDGASYQEECAFKTADI